MEGLAKVLAAQSPTVKHAVHFFEKTLLTLYNRLYKNNFSYSG